MTRHDVMLRSGLGTKPTSRPVRYSVATGGKADIEIAAASSLYESTPPLSLA
jgi:hypothetical protein